MTNVTLPRRKFLHLAAGAVALPAMSRVVRAQAYPTRPVRIVVGFPAGGAIDLFARLIGQWLSNRLGQSFVIENRPGWGSNVATEAVARAPADGYTLLQLTSVNAWNASLYDRLNFDIMRDIVPIASLSRGFGVLVVHPAFPVKSVPELISYAKANPRKIDMASAGIGTAQHIYGELFKAMTGVDMQHVPYRGGAQALTDLLAGQVRLMFDTVATSIEHIRTGKLRALAVTSATRLDILPDVPSIAEFVPGYEAEGWQGIGAPRDTPTAVIDMLNEQINAGLADPTISARIADSGYSVFASSRSDFTKFVPEYTLKWAKVIKFAGIKAE
jgi:tripartite-type tricarboxylate transporter receptor subunit TctC